VDLTAFVLATRLAYAAGHQFPGQESDEGQVAMFAAFLAGAGRPRVYACRRP